MSLEVRAPQGTAPCIDEECLTDDGNHSVAEIERDGQHAYFECPECGSTFGYQRLDSDVDSETCAIGVPEELRRRMSSGMEFAMDAERRTEPVPIQLGRKP